MTHVFGTRAFYHRKVMFAMLPDQRTLEGSAAISFIALPKGYSDGEPSWQTFGLTGHNLDEALVLLEQAYKLSVLRPFPDFRPLRTRVHSAVKSGDHQSLYAVR